MTLSTLLLRNITTIIPKVTTDYFVCCDRYQYNLYKHSQYLLISTKKFSNMFEVLNIFTILIISEVYI